MLKLYNDNIRKVYKEQSYWYFMEFNSLISNLHLGFLFGVVFLSVLIVIVSYAKSLPVKGKNRKKTNSYSKNMLVIFVFFTILTIILTILFTNYLVTASEDDYNSKQDVLRENLQRRLQDSLHTIDLISSDANLNQAELNALRQELEYSINQLSNKPEKRKTKIVYITTSGY